MFARTAALVSVLTLAVLAAATPAANSAAKAKPTKTITITSTPAPTGGPTGKCSTGDIQCCNTATSVSVPTILTLVLYLLTFSKTLQTVGPGPGHRRDA